MFLVLKMWMLTKKQRVPNWQTKHLNTDMFLAEQKEVTVFMKQCQGLSVFVIVVDIKSE